MSSFHELEASTYAKLREKPFTRMQGKQDWKQMKTLQKEMDDTSMTCAMTYNWAKDYGLLAEIQGAEWYLQITTQRGTAQTYVTPVKPPHTHPEIQANSTAHIVQLRTAEKYESKRNWYMGAGFRKAMGAVELAWISGWVCGGA